MSRARRYWRRWEALSGAQCWRARCALRLMRPGMLARPRPIYPLSRRVCARTAACPGCWGRCVARQRHAAGRGLHARGAQQRPSPSTPGHPHPHLQYAPPRGLPHGPQPPPGLVQATRPAQLAALLPSSYPIAAFRRRSIEARGVRVSYVPHFPGEDPGSKRGAGDGAAAETAARAPSDSYLEVVLPFSANPRLRDEVGTRAAGSSPPIAGAVTLHDGAPFLHDTDAAALRRWQQRGRMCWRGVVCGLFPGPHPAPGCPCPRRQYERFRSGRLRLGLVLEDVDSLAADIAARHLAGSGHVRMLWGVCRAGWLQSGGGHCCTLPYPVPHSRVEPDMPNASVSLPQGLAGHCGHHRVNGQAAAGDARAAPGTAQAGSRCAIHQRRRRRRR